MTYTFVSLDESLRGLPTLRDVLGRKWIERETGIPPVESAFPLARTLRIIELRNLVVTLDRRLTALWDIKGADDWRRRLRNNGQEFRELLTELSFATLLQEHGCAFEHPDDGPDFAISIGDGSPLKIEAITPRVIAWDDDLGARLWMLSRQFGYSVRRTPLTDDLPILSEEVTERMMQRIVRDAVNALDAAHAQRSVVEQTYDNVGLRIDWTPSPDPVFSGRNSPNSSPVRAFNYIWDAAEKKAKQLRRGNAHTLLIGTNQLPLGEWGLYVESVRRQVPFYGHFDWTQIHPQVNHIILYEATYGDGRYPAIDVLVRAEHLTMLVDGLDRFFAVLGLAGEDYHRQRAEDERELVERLMQYEARQDQALGIT